MKELAGDSGQRAGRKGGSGFECNEAVFDGEADEGGEPRGTAQPYTPSLRREWKHRPWVPGGKDGALGAPSRDLPRGKAISLRGYRS